MYQEPIVTSDPRFRAGRTLVRTAGEGAIGMFATLVEESRTKYGDTSIETAACYYEYGNALFRAASRRQNETSTTQDDESTPSPPSASAAAAAAEKRRAMANAAERRVSQQSTETESKPSTTKNDSSQRSQSSNKQPSNDENNDVSLALELMENAWSILDEYVTSTPPPKPYHQWANDQLPRILIGIGDVLSHLHRRADAVDAYMRSIPYREADANKIEPSDKNEIPTLDYLKCRRLIVEAYALVAEEILACGEDEDVVTSETETVLVKKEERVDFARGYYDKARDELQETVYLMGRIASSGRDLGTEKEDICFLATILMGVGNTLADLDEVAEGKKDGGQVKKSKKG